MKRQKIISELHFKTHLALWLVVVLFTNIYAPIVCAAQGDPISDSSCCPSDDELIPTKSDKLVEILNTYDLSTSTKTHVFVFNIGQGNFIVLRNGNCITLVDVSNTLGNGLKKEEFQKVLQKIFDGADITSIIITHAHEDHLGGLDILLQEVKRWHNVEKLPSIKVFLSDLPVLHKIKDRTLPEIIDDFCSPGSVYYHRNSSCTEWEKYEFHGVDKPKFTRFRRKKTNKRLTSAIFCKEAGEMGKLRAEFLDPVLPIVTKSGGENSKSLVIKITFYGKSILFTGDATECTFNAIIGDASSSSPIKEKSTINRSLLKSVHFLIAPHHGSGSEGSSLWLDYINSRNYYSFAGVIFSAPIKSPFGHPHQHINMLPFFNSVKTHYITYSREGSNSTVQSEYGLLPETKRRRTNKPRYIQRQRYTQDPIFETSAVSIAQWLVVSEEGMEIFIQGEFYPLLSNDGWSIGIQKLVKAFDTDDNIALAGAIGAFLQTPKILQTRNAEGKTCFEWLQTKSRLSVVEGQPNYGKILGNIERATLVASGEIPKEDSLFPLCEQFRINGMTKENFHETFLEKPKGGDDVH